MADPGRAASDAAGSVAEAWRRLDTEQRVAAVGAILLIVSTFGPFSFVEAAIVLTGLAILALLKQRADRKDFHLPFGDGTVILAAGLWSAVLILARLFDRPFGQSALAFGCAAIVAAAGLRERAHRGAYDEPPPPPAEPPDQAPMRIPAAEDETVHLAPDEDATVRLPPDEPARPE